jgi:glycosyltransferase involved in cell wall biosynthesis
MAGTGLPATEPEGTLAGAERRRAALHVTMIGALPPWRGVAPYTRHLLEALEDVDDLDVEFIDFSSLYPRRLYPGGDPIDRKGRTGTFRRTRVRRLLAWYNPLSWVWAGLTLRGDIVHAQWWSPILAPVYAVVLGLARLRGRRVVITPHNVEPHERGLRQRWLFRSVLPLAHHFIVHSPRNAEALARRRLTGSGAISVVPHGILTVDGARDVSREAARAGLGLPREQPVVLTFGNIRPYKGLDVLLRAFRRLRDGGVEATLAVAGEPWGSFEPYRRLADELGLNGSLRTWLGFVPEEQASELFRAADVAVFPYRHFDAQSGAASLALSFGLPLVVSDVGGLPELVLDARAVVPPDDPEALAQALRAVVTDASLREKLAADSRRRAAELDWPASAARTAEVYAAVSRMRADR